ncbi:MAG TPA: AraC family transcriptional regulator [Steroidobacteraceae bacterium]|nr:AraC family transcriptional regulator [Steroidobacteraceae bacterium]
MTELSIKLQLDTATANVRDVICDGACRHKSAVECAQTTFLVFPYRGVYVRHAGRNDSVAESNQVVFFNKGEEYRISHPVAGGDACLSVGVAEHWLDELTPQEHVRDEGELAFRRQRLRIDARTQALVATLRYSLDRKVAETLEAETLTLTLIRRALGERTSHAAGASVGRQKLVDRAKLLLSSDPARRWTLSEIGAAVGVSPVYLTQVFQQVEGLPLYRYHLRLRLARALDLLGEYDDLTSLSMDLGFSSHSHFTASFRQAYGRTPAEFQRSLRLR